MIAGLNAAASALNVYSSSLAVTAGNVANINTNGYKAKTVSTAETVPSGVKISSVRATENPVYVQAAYNNGYPSSDVMLQKDTFFRVSNVELSREKMKEIIALRSFQANAKVLSTVNSMLGTLIDLKA